MREGYECTPEHRENVRKASFIREATIRRKVNVNGVVYPNVSQAARANGLSPRSIARYATSSNNSKVFYL